MQLVGGGSRVIRVQVYARVAVRGGEDTTLRVGSSDGRKTMHVDDEQTEDVVKPLAEHFYLGPCAHLASMAIKHYYLKAGRATHAALSVAVEGGGEDAMSSESPEESGKLPEESGELPDVVTFLDYMVGDKDDDWVEVKSTIEGDDRSKFRRDVGFDPITLKQIADAKVITPIIDAAGVDLSHRVDMRPIEHTVEVRKVEESIESPLPFDVEVHQLESGQRMVLNTHRLLIPDVKWIDWMWTDPAARPRVWAIMPGDEGPVYRGQLDLELEPQRRPLAVDVIPAVSRWCSSMDGVPSGDLVTLSDAAPESLHGSGMMLLQASNRETPDETLCSFVVSSPAWHWGNNPYLTCLLTPEAACVLREHHPDGLETSKGLRKPSPDAAMYHCDPEPCMAACDALLTASLDRVTEAVLQEASHGEDADLRARLKVVLHSHGLSMRHIRYVLEKAGGDIAEDVRRKIVRAVAVPR